MKTTENQKQTTGNSPANHKQAYTPPQVEVIEMETEGVLALSNLGGSEAFSARRPGSYNSAGRNGYNSASTSDLEDLINDILTIEQ